MRETGGVCLSDVQLDYASQIFFCIYEQRIRSTSIDEVCIALQWLVVNDRLLARLVTWQSASSTEQ